MSTDENQVFLALQEWYQTDTYNLYQSDPQGVYYSIVLENVRSTKQPEESVLIDILEVRANQPLILSKPKWPTHCYLFSDPQWPTPGCVIIRILHITAQARSPQSRHCGVLYPAIDSEYCKFKPA